MQTQILDGYKLAEQFQKQLKVEVDALSEQGIKPTVAAILFREDTGSQLYTQLKKEMALSLGIEYRVFEFSVLDKIENVLAKIKELNQQIEITGIIIQKPWRKTWVDAHDSEINKEAFNSWWEELVVTIAIEKDIDGLHPSNLLAIQQGEWREKGRVLPATCQAVLRLLELAFQTDHLFSKLRTEQLKTIIIGKSDLLGQPLHAVMTSKNCMVEMIGSKELSKRIEDKVFLKDADVVVTATGKYHLINGSFLKTGTVVIDVGEPRGDADQASVMGIAAALSPVPGGVGPMTVISLMENTIELLK